jgi:hypothetical protein
MLTLLEALTAERDKRRQSFRQEALQRQLSRQVLHHLAERLAAARLPRWYFIPNGDEIVVVHNKDGTGSRHRIGAWTIDAEHCLVFGSERTEWITSESYVRVLDTAILITAQAILDHDVQVNPEALAAAVAPPQAQRPQAVDSKVASPAGAVLQGPAEPPAAPPLAPPPVTRP